MGRNRPRVTLDSWRGTQDGREMTCQTFPIDVDTLFALLFTNSEFYIDFHTARKTIGKIYVVCERSLNLAFFIRLPYIHLLCLELNRLVYLHITVKLALFLSCLFFLQMIQCDSFLSIRLTIC